VATTKNVSPGQGHLGQRDEVGEGVDEDVVHVVGAEARQGEACDAQDDVQLKKMKLVRQDRSMGRGLLTSMKLIFLKIFLGCIDITPMHSIAMQIWMLTT
jgi:hypothetical protein